MTINNILDCEECCKKEVCRWYPSLDSDTTLELKNFKDSLDPDDQSPLRVTVSCSQYEKKG